MLVFVCLCISMNTCTKLINCWTTWSGPHYLFLVFKIIRLMSIFYTWLVHRQPHTLIHSLRKYYRKVRTAMRAYVNIVHASLCYLSRDGRYHWHRQLKTKSRHRTLYWHCWKKAVTWTLKALLEVICIECTDNVRLTKSGVRLKPSSSPPLLNFFPRCTK